MTYFYGVIILYFLTTQSNIVLNSSLLPAFEISCKILKNTRKVTFYWKTQVDLKVKVFNILTMQGNIFPQRLYGHFDALAIISYNHSVAWWRISWGLNIFFLIFQLAFNPFLQGGTSKSWSVTSINLFLKLVFQVGSFFSKVIEDWVMWG